MTSPRGPWPARAAYVALLRLVQPLYLLRLWWRGRREAGYREALAERFGHYAIPAAPGALWLHAVSLGETRAAAPLIAALRERRPGLRLLLTHGTATGRAAGAALLRPGDAQTWLPYDTPGAVARFFRHFRPAAGVLMETEVWPGLVAGAADAGVPVVLANARLSARSLARGRRVAALLRPAFAQLRVALAQGAADAERLRAAGVQQVEVAGNLKFDMAPDPALLARGRAWRAAVARPVVLAAIFREGEEAQLFDVWAGLDAPRPLLVVVPRHPQRFDEVAAAVGARGWALARRSAWREAPPAGAGDLDVWLGDSLGEMALYYALADVALMGGSFAPLGGHNLIEAAACGCPVVLGPHTFNFAEASERAVEAGAARRAADMAEAVGLALGLLQAGRETSAERAVAFASQHRGAAARMAERILKVMAGDA